MRYKAGEFLGGCVKGEFVSFRTYDLLVRAEEIAGRITETTGREDFLVERYGELVAATHSLEFTWPADAPQEVRALETWWEMVQQGKTDGDSFLFFASELPVYVVNEYNSAVGAALTVWTPLATRPENQLTEAQKADPN